MEEHFRDRGENILGKIVQKEKDYEAEREQIGKVLEALDKRGNQPGGNEQESTDPEATKKPKLDLNLEPEWEPTYLAEAEQIYGRLKLVLLKHAFAPVVADAQRRLLSSPTTSLNQNHAEKTRKIVRNIIKDLADKKEDLPANLEELANSKKAEIEQRILEAHQP
ncbi:hypothetical protein OWV82_007560 [Melia azedarach]|uniref:Uncharacterized protein n=1 Tax=Melia azedarach TaxID=155640 RepID=A0ACC1YAL5_MELAZ|nr:hypothetical protein OWV82_007560 [Melia azedarach]